MNRVPQPSLTVEVRGIGVLGPGLATWSDAAACLREPARWQHVPTVVPAPQRLPATERRRAGTVVKAAIVVADEALAAAGLAADVPATVFTSSTGDPLNCHLLCEALASAERLVSPTRFTNSVHNAPAGYWHIAAAATTPSTSLAAYDASFAAGLLEAASQVVASGLPVLLVAVDVPYPEPLAAKRPIADTMALALLLVPCGAAGRGPALSLLHEALPASDASTRDRCRAHGFEALRPHIPAARALPLLELLAMGESGSVAIEDLPGSRLVVTVQQPAP
jgi:Beta-ketoacyl synthase, N-terminal domain